ncbi:MAG TPA: histidinol dehydrogenase [Stellaceae bacterium]|nr:histidinol dehydrogenase [Stellaceae bacterium]
MPRHIKTAALAGQQEEADARVRGTVEGIIADVAKRGDEAVRELSERFDKWSPPSFRLSAREIAALVAKVAPQTIDDIKFAQAQIRRFAEIQRDSLHDMEVETLPGVVLGYDHKGRARWRSAIRRRCMLCSKRSRQNGGGSTFWSTRSRLLRVRRWKGVSPTVPARAC